MNKINYFYHTVHLCRNLNQKIINGITHMKSCQGLMLLHFTNAKTQFTNTLKCEIDV